MKYNKINTRDLVKLQITTLADLKEFLNNPTIQQMFATWFPNNSSESIIQELTLFVNTAIILNQNNPFFPLYCTTIEYFVNDTDFLFKFNLQFQDFILLFQCIDANDHKTLDYSTFNLFAPNDFITHFNDYIAYLKFNQHNKDLMFNQTFLINPQMRNYKVSYLDHKGSTVYFQLYDDKFKSLKNFLKDTDNLITTFNLDELALLILNPLDDINALRTNPLYIHTSYHNILRSYYQKLVLQDNEDIKPSLASIGWINNPNNLQLSFYFNNRDLDINVKNKNFIINHHTVSNLALADSIWLNHLNYFANVSYDNTSAVAILDQYENGRIGLNQLKTKRQQINFSSGILSGTEIGYFYAFDDINTFNQFANYNLAFKIEGDWYEHFFTYANVVPKKDGGLYQIITLRDESHRDNVYLVQLNTNNQIDFLNAMFSNVAVSFKQDKSGNYNYKIANENLKLFTDYIVNNLSALPNLFPTRTIYTKQILTFSQPTNTPYFTQSQSFLTFSPMIDQNLNQHTFTKTNLQADNLIASFNFNHQDTHYLTLENRASLIQFFYEAKKQIGDLGYSVMSYLMFLAWLSRYFVTYYLYHKNYGFITNVINFNGLLNTNLSFHHYNNSTKVISQADVDAGYKFYQDFLQAFYDTFINKEFIQAWYETIKKYQHKEDYCDYIKQIIGYFKQETAFKDFFSNSTDFKVQEAELVVFFDQVLQKKNTEFDFMAAVYTLETRARELSYNDFLNEPFYALINTYMLKFTTKLNNMEIKPQLDYYLALADNKIVASPKTVIENKNKRSRL